MPQPQGDIDFFISYTGKDQSWAEWIAWQLEEAGYKTLIQAWDFKSGGVFPADMHRALQQSARVIAVLTPDYMASAFCQPEWQAAFANDPTGEKGILVCVRVSDFKPDGLLRGRTYIDLVGKNATTAAAFLLERLKQGRAKPTTQPIHPPASASPAYPESSGGLATPVPHYLPRLDHFHGREKELAQIHDALRPEKRTWGALIAGPGGMGKTSLAVQAASFYSSDQFDPVIFVSIKDRALEDDGPRAVQVRFVSHYLGILDEIARALGRDDIPRSTPEDRARLILGALTGTRALLILDNLESLTPSDRERIVEFVSDLPGICKAILTARRRIGRGINLIELDKLDEAAALDTLADIAEHNPLLARATLNDRRNLWEATAGIPLLLRWTAGQLGRGSCRNIPAAIAHLRSCPENNDPLEFIFGDLANEFTPDETQILCALIYFTLPAKVEHIAANAGIAESLAETALGTLANRSLVTDNAEGTHYALVPLVSDFLRNKKPDIIAETGNRLEKRAYALIIENGYQNHDRFPTLETAWPGIAPALSIFLAGDNTRLQIVCEALSNFLHFQGRWDEHLALSEAAETKAVAASDHNNAGWRAYHAGMIHSLRQQADAVIACAERAATLWNYAQAGNRERATAIRLLGIGYQLKGDYPAAITAYREALDLFRKLAAETKDLAIVLNDLAEAEKDSGDFTAAKEYYLEALRVARDLGYTEGVAYITGNLASLALGQQDWPTAETLARETLPLANTLGRQELIASNIRGLAKALMHQGRTAEALPYAQKAVEIFTRLASPSLTKAQAILTECEAALSKPAASSPPPSHPA
jgi:tetratricopeptide (TPR) repeat protein